MNLFELFVKIGVDDQASNNISKITSGLGKGLQTAAKIGTAAVGAAATGIAALTASAVKNYAEYEQLVGGVDTLFKSSSQKVQEYAANAFRTAGMSANEYMSTVTSFSASLLQSLGGDTDKAAEYANQALTDMSDNANKMGTSMEMIQNAYQGFAKQNYTMLDNLKLGYGGTKEEMARLIEDAAKLSDTVDAQDMSFGNIVKAINVVQTEMGITGTTAKEAASTISGSISMVSASWTNLATGIADENANIDNLISSFVDSVVIAGDNILPRVEVAMDGVTRLVEGVFPKLAEVLPKTIINIAPKLIQSGVSAIKAFAGGLKNNKKALTDGIKVVSRTLVSGIGDVIPDLIDVAGDAVVAVAEALPDLVIAIVRKIPDIMASIGRAVINAGGAVIKAFAEVLDPNTWRYADVRHKFEEIASSVSPFVDEINEYAGKVADFAGALSEGGRTIENLDDMIDDTESKITEIIQREFAEQDGYRQEDLANIRKYMDELDALQNEKLSIYRSRQMSELRKLQFESGNITSENIAEFLGNAQTYLAEANKQSDEMYTEELVRLENYYRSVGKLDSEEHKNAILQAKKNNDERLAENQRYYDAAVAGLTSVQWGQEDVITNFLSTLPGLYADITNAKELWQSGLQNEAKEKYAVSIEGGALASLFYGLQASNFYGQAESEYAQAIANIDFDALNEYLTIVSKIKSAGGTLTDKDVNAIKGIIRILSSAPNKNDESYKNAFDTLTAGLDEIIDKGEDGILTIEDLQRVLLEGTRLTPEVKSRYNSAGSVAGSEFVNGFNNATYDLFIKYTPPKTSSGGSVFGTGVNVVQNIFSQAKTAADLMEETLYQYGKVVAFG